MKALLIAAGFATMFSTAAFAQMDCDKMVDASVTKLSSMKASAGKRAALARMIATGYDYCMAGDEFSAEKFFKMLEESARNK